MSSRNSSHKKKSPHSSRTDPAPTQPSPILEVRDSSVHGHGVYAKRRIRKGTRIIEYTGKQVAWADVPDDDDPHTFLFSLENGLVINPEIGGNEARWINHSCDPNCEAIGRGDRIFIYALKDIRPGEELSYDYSLDLDEPLTEKLLEDYRCHCGAARCRGTMLDISEATSRPE